MAEYFRLARSFGKTVFFDPGPMIPRIPKDYLWRMIAETDILIVNDEEAGLLTGYSTGLEASELLTKFVQQQVVVKLGAEGCFV